MKLVEHVLVALGEVSHVVFHNAPMTSPKTYAKFCRRTGFESMVSRYIKAYVEALSQERLNELLDALAEHDERTFDDTVSDVLFEDGEVPQRFIEVAVASRLLVDRCYDYWSKASANVKVRAEYVELLKFIRLQAQAIRERELKGCVSTLPLLKRP